MKVLTVLVALVGIVTSEDWMPKTSDEMNAIRKDCIAANPLTEEQQQKMKLFEYPDEECVRKYILCSTSKIGIFCESEGYHIDRVVKQFKTKIDEAEIAVITEQCADKNVEKSTADVWAFRGHQCLLRSKLGDLIKKFIKEQYHGVKA